MASLNKSLQPFPKTSASRHRVLIVVMDGVGLSDLETHVAVEVSRHSTALPSTAFARGNAVNAAHTPHLATLLRSPHARSLKAHGPAVGLPSWEDMGNSEVGHNALGAGRIFAQGAKLVGEAIASGALFQGETWKEVVEAPALRSGLNTLHLCGLLSDGGVHSHIDHIEAVVRGAKASGVKRVRIHTLLDGRDVGPVTAHLYLQRFESFLASLRGPDFDARIASGGGRMFVTMDRYESDWRIVQRGYDAHVHGKARGFESALSAVETYRAEIHCNDQDLPPFVVEEKGAPIGKVVDGDSFLFLNFRGDRAIQITRALTEADFQAFDRHGLPPKLRFAGMMQYDGDLKIPERYLVTPPAIADTMGELLAATGVRQFACSETQKYGHVTYFWNGNRSGKFNDALESYFEIPSDLVPFEQRPWMKAAEITDVTIKHMREGSFSVGRINYANGDMVGHTGSFDAAVEAVEAVDLCLGRLLIAARETNTVLLVTADHGNCEQMFEIDKKSKSAALDASGAPRLKTSHTLNPVPFVVFNGEACGASFALRDDLPDAGLANVAATTLELAGFTPPTHFEPSLLRWEPPAGDGGRTARNLLGLELAGSETVAGKRASAGSTGGRADNNASEGAAPTLASLAEKFQRTIAKLRAPGGCPWDREQSFASLTPFMLEEAYEAVDASNRLSVKISSPSPLTAVETSPGSADSVQPASETRDAAFEFADELGDVLLQIFLNAQIASEAGLFRVEDIFAAIDAKMIRRHPHVFTPEAVSANSAADVENLWKTLKDGERGGAAEGESLLDKAARKRHLPTLTYLEGVSQRSAKHGFAWPDLKGTFTDLESEVAELKTEVFAASPDWNRIRDEIGDVVFSLSNLSVFLDSKRPAADPPLQLDLAAREACSKFVSRFRTMEELMQERGDPLSAERASMMSLDEWNRLWSDAKKRRYR